MSATSPIKVRGSNLIKGRKSVPIKKLVSALTRETTGDVVLPANCRFAFQTKRQSLFVLEYEPQIRTMPWYRSVPDGQGSWVWEQYSRIALPYVVLAFAFDHHGRKTILRHVYCFFNDKPLKTVKDELWVASMPNTYRDGHICMGHGSIKQNNRGMTERLNSAVTHFWTRGFNKGTGQEMMPPEKWHYETKRHKTPDWIIRDFPRNCKTSLSQIREFPFKSIDEYSLSQAAITLAWKRKQARKRKRKV